MPLLDQLSDDPAEVVNMDRSEPQIRVTKQRRYDSPSARNRQHAIDPFIASTAIDFCRTYDQ